jgi:hypothetical protein
VYSEHLSVVEMSSNSEPPPAFVSDTKCYADYKADLQMWSRISSLDPKLQAEVVVYRLEGDPSRIKEKIVTQIGEKLKDNADGMKELILFLDGIYEKEDMAEAWDRYIDFASATRKDDQSMAEFIPEWRNSCHKAKSVGCDFSDTILAFKLLQDASLPEMDIKLVLTGVDYASGKTKKNLLDQVVESLKKFKGQGVMSGCNRRNVTDVEVKVEPAWLADVQHVLISKGWKPPSKGPRRRSRSVSPVRSNYKGKKNRLDGNFKPLKCHICRCNHVENCNCPCVYHLQADCPSRRTSPDDLKGLKPELSYFMNTLLGDDDRRIIL